MASNTYIIACASVHRCHDTVQQTEVEVLTEIKNGLWEQWLVAVSRWGGKAMVLKQLLTSMMTAVKRVDFDQLQSKQLSERRSTKQDGQRQVS